MRLDLVGGKPEERNGEASNWEGQLDGSRDFWRTETEEHIIIQKKRKNTRKFEKKIDYI